MPALAPLNGGAALRIVISVPLALLLVLGGCVSREEQIAGGQQRYLAARTACVTEYPRSLVRQSECRTRAANEFIRPWYRYPDLMTFAQDKRMELAIKVDAGTMTRAEFDRQVAKAESAVDKEEARRNDGALSGR
jgi:hypothetical protein